MATDELRGAFAQAFDDIERARADFDPALAAREIGTVASVGTGIAQVTGLPGVGFEELLVFPGDLYGIAFNLDADAVGVVLLGEYRHLQAGAPVRRSGCISRSGWWMRSA